MRSDAVPLGSPPRKNKQRFFLVVFETTTTYKMKWDVLQRLSFRSRIPVAKEETSRRKCEEGDF